MRGKLQSTSRATACPPWTANVVLWILSAVVIALLHGIVGTVMRDLHDIGKNLVAMMLEGAGFEIVDLGTDVSPEKFVNAVVEHKPRPSPCPRC